MNCGFDFLHFFLFTRGVRGGGAAGSMEVKFVVRLSTNILQRLDRLKLFWPPPNPSLNSLTQQTWDFLHRRPCRSTRYSQSSGEPNQKKKKKSSAKPSHFLQPWHSSLTWGKPRARLTFGPLIYLFSPPLMNGTLLGSDLSAWCFSLLLCWNVFPLQQPTLRGSEAVSARRGNKIRVDVCLLRGSYTIKVDLTLGGVNICYFCRDTCSRWPVELAAWNENVAALCSHSKCFIWASSLLAHNPQPVVTALKPSVLLYVEIGRAVCSAGDWGG